MLILSIRERRNVRGSKIGVLLGDLCKVLHIGVGGMLKSKTRSRKEQHVKLPAFTWTLGRRKMNFPLRNHSRHQALM